MSNESKLYDPLDLDTQPVRRKKRVAGGFNDLRRRMPVEQARVVRQPAVLMAFVKPLKPVSQVKR
jgi:hypothetical protein